MNRVLTLEQTLTSPQAFGLVTASPVQRAACRVVDSTPLGELGADPVVHRAFFKDGEAYVIPRPREMYVVSGSRVGKTLFAAALGFHLTQTVDVSHLGPGDDVRLPILSLDRDKAAACYTHLTATMKARKALRPLLVDEGRNELNALAVWIKHPSGRVIQVCVTADKAAGNAVVSYFLAGCIVDEWCKMHGQGDAVVNFDETRRNALGRILLGGMFFGLGSAWAPYGPAYDTVQECHGKPTPQTCVVRARGRDMNPSWWTPERIAGTPKDVLRTEEEGEFLDAESDLFSSIEVQACLRPAGDLPRELGHEYAAVMDPATRGNGWPLLIFTRTEHKIVIVAAREWIGSKLEPTSIRSVFAEMKPLLELYGVDMVTTDQWSSDGLREIADGFGIAVVQRTRTSPEKVSDYDELGTCISDGQIEMPEVPHLREDLLRVKKRPTAASFTIVEPKTKDGRHCDFAAALSRVPLLSLGLTPPSPPPPPHGSAEATRLELAELQQKRIDAIESEGGKSWWERDR